MSGDARLTLSATLATAATATVLSALFTGAGWFVPTMGAIGLVGLVGHLARRSRLPSVLGPLLAAAAVLCWLTLLDARHVAVLGVIPGPAALHRLSVVTNSGFTDIHRLATPVPDHRGLVLITTVAIAVVALVVDLLAVTVRRVALAGLPLLATLTTCAGVGRNGISVVAFVLAALGFLGLLYADSADRVRRWGVRVGHGDRSVGGLTDTALPAPLSRRIGATAIGVGLLVPVIVPGLHDGIDRRHRPSGLGGPGGGQVVTVDPIVSVSHDLKGSATTTVLDYTTNEPDPGYLRLTSLDVFNGSSFSGRSLIAPSNAQVNGSLPVPARSGPQVSTQVSVTPTLDEHWLPLPIGVTAVKVPDDWRFDASTGTVFSASSSTVSLRYDTVSEPQPPSAEQLRDASASSNPSVLVDAQLPKTIDRSVIDLTHQVVAGATSAYQRAIDIQNYLTSARFTYNVDVPPDPSPQALAHFLLHTRTGFCQQFSTAMAAMARIAGIPSRVAVGFTRGTQQPNGTWVVTTHDAHAWPELYFNGFGWLPFEPTPRADGQAVAATYAQPRGLRAHSGSGAGQSPSTSPTPSASTSAQHRPANPTRGFGNGGKGSGAGGAGGNHGHGVGAVIALAILALLVVVAIAPGAARTYTRRRRWRALAANPAAIGYAWAELYDTARDLHVPWPAGRTPAETGRQLAAWLRPGSEVMATIERVVVAEQHARYAPHPLPGDGSARRDVVALEQAIRARRSQGQRLRARVAPRSTLADWRAGLERRIDRLRSGGVRGRLGRLSDRRSGAASGPRAV